MVGSEKDLPAWRSLMMGRRGAVVSQHALATQAGIDVLQSGGNAFDAAVAIGATLAVVEPHASGVGGEGLFLLREAEGNRTSVIQAFGRSPRAATRERLDGGLDRLGARAAVVPALPAGWAYLIERFATQPAPALFEAAVHYARDGFPATEAVSRQVLARRDLLLADPGCAERFFVEGEPPRPGATLDNPALGRTLEDLAERGGWSSRALPMRSLVEFVHRQDGFYSDRDFEEIEIVRGDPLSIDYRGVQVLSAPPPSMGFALLLNLAIVSHFELSKLAHGGADVVHLLVEAKKMAFGERERCAGDPAHVSIPLEDLLGPSLAKQLALKIDPRRPTPPPGTIQSIRGDTSYFAVVDETGNAVSGIQSLAEAFGACVLDPASGIVLNNRMAWFHAQPEHPNSYGPARYPRHTMNAPMVLRDGELLAVLGATAGDAQHQTALQILAAMIDYGFAPQQAVEAPRWTHFQPGTGSAHPHQTPDVLVVESRFESHVLEELKRRGHNVATVGPMDDVGNAGIIWRDPRGVLVCGADPRHGGWAGTL